MNLGGTVRLNRTGWLAVMAVACLLLFIQYARSPSPRKAVVSGSYSLPRLLRASILAARAGGEAVTQERSDNGARSKGKTLEGVDQPVTHADLDSHCRMTSVIKDAFPGVYLISEEHPEGGVCPPTPPFASVDVDDLSNLPDVYVDAEDVTVWIDPLDATKEFGEKLFQYVTTMVCVAIKGVPVIGVIYKPFPKEMSWTWLSTASSPNLQKISNDDTKKPSEMTRVIVSISHQGKVKEIASDVFGPNHKLIPAAGSGYKVLELVHDNADIYLHRTMIQKWDICAGNAILNYFNGKMTTLKNTTIDYSHSSSVKNKEGLLASMKNHNKYMEKILKLSP